MEWKTVKLGKVCDLIKNREKGVLIDKSNYVSTENMLPNKGGVVPSSITPYDGAIIYHPKDVLISNIRPYFKKIWFADKIGGCSGDVLCFRSNSKIDSTYLYYLLSQDSFFDYVMAGSKGTKMPRGDKGQIMQYEFSLPPLETQRRIASILSSLDDKIENNNRINRNLEEQAQALFKSWFVDFEPWGGTMPEDWRNEVLGEICKIKYGKGLGTNLLTDEGYPVFGGNGVIGYYSKFLYELPQILVSCRGAASGKIMETDPHSFVTSNSLVLEMNDRAYYYYLKYLLLANPLYNYATGSAQPQITIDNIKDVDIVLPSIDIVNTISEKFEVIDEQIRSLRRENLRLAALRDTLLPKLMRGEIEL